MRDGGNASDKTGAGLVTRPGVVDKLGVHGRFHVECYDRDGNLKWVEDCDNLWPNAGKNYALDSALRTGVSTPAIAVGLKGTGTVVAGDTMASHGGWSELTPYSNGTRPDWGEGAASNGQMTNGSPAVFNINGTSTIYGAFLATDNTKGGTTGTLISAADFSGSRAVSDGDTLNVTYTVSL